MNAISRTEELDAVRPSPSILRARRAKDFVRCRTYGHAWFDYDSTWQTNLGVPLTLRCERCGTERRDVVNRHTGDLVTRRYDYAEGYQYDHEETPDRNDFRRMLLGQRISEARAARKQARQAS